MDEHRFDAMVRAIAGRAANRRGALRALAGAGFAGALGRVGTAAAACRRRQQTCGDGQGRCCNDLACCGGRCRNLQTDERFCGGCRTACDVDQGQTCRAGQCVCPDGRPPCGGTCCPDNCYCNADNRCECPRR